MKASLWDEPSTVGERLDSEESLGGKVEVKVGATRDGMNDLLLNDGIGAFAEGQMEQR